MERKDMKQISIRFNEDMYQWIITESEKLAMAPSVYIRMIIAEKMTNLSKEKTQDLL